MPNLVPPPPTSSVSATTQTNPVWINWFNAVYRLLGLAPTIYSGILAPAFIPRKIGDTFVDTVTQKVYVSVGTSSSADWKILN